LEEDGTKYPTGASALMANTRVTSREKSASPQAGAEN
jgi:hypothetical protein